MSQPPHDTANFLDAGTGGPQHQPQWVPAKAPQGVSTFVDGSGPLFSMYLEMTTEEDKKMVENWKEDADGILIFTGLFSAAVASLISVSIQDIRQDPQDTSNFYLANIYETLARPSRSNSSGSLPPPPFSPPTYAVWVNALWFLSLVISLTCALLATLLQQWVRRYLKVSQSRYSPHKRARIRTFLAEGVEKLLLPWTVEALPTLLHISLFLFFAGLVVFLSNINFTIFKLVLSWVGFCTALYGCITFMPIFRHDSPYHTPLSLPAWHIVTGIRFLTFRALRSFALLDCGCRGTYVHFRDSAGRYRKWLVQGMQKTVEETALNSPSEIDTRALLWTFDSSDEDHELERFFSGLPGFRTSNLVKDPLPSLPRKAELFTALIGLLDRTFASDSLPEHVKKQRAMICVKAFDPAHIPEALKATVYKIVARAQSRDESWFILASKFLCVPEAVLRGYAAHGDSLSLAILIHATRQQISRFWELFWPRVEFSTVLEAASTFNVRDTSPELQHEFCALWNQIVHEVQIHHYRPMASLILRPIRNVHIALHQGADSDPTRFSASTGDEDAYPYHVCNIPDYHPDSTPHIHDNSAHTTFSRAVLHDHDYTELVLPFSSSSPDTPPAFAHVPRRFSDSFADTPPLISDVSASVCLQPVDQTTTESRRIPGPSLNPVTTRAIHGSSGPSSRTTQLFTPEPSSSTSPRKSKASTSPPGAIAVEHPAVGCEVSSTLPPTQVLDDMPVLQTESSSMLLAPGAPGPSRPWLSSANLGAAVEGHSSAKPPMRQEMGTLNPSSAIMATPDLPPPSPSPQPTIEHCRSQPS